MTKKQSKKTGVVKSVLNSELKKAKLYKLGEPSLGQQILNTVSSIHAPVSDLGNEFKQSFLFFTELNQFKDELQDYENTVNELLGSIKTYEQNPLLKEFREVEVFYKDFNKSREKVENELYYQLTESELKDANNKNKHLQKKLKKALKKIKKDKQLVDLAYKVIKDKNQKTTNSKTPKTLTLNPNFDDFKGQTETIYKETQTLFKSTLEQWQNLFTNGIQTFSNPIELKQSTTIADLRYFFNQLVYYKLIKTNNFNSIIEKTKSFQFNSKLIKAQQLATANVTLKNCDSTHKSIIDNIFNSLNLTD